MLGVRELEVTYAGGRRGLRGVSLSVGPGEVVAVGGGSGSGKTTLLRAISGLLALHRGRVTAGAISLSGRSLVGLPAARIVRLGAAYVGEGRRVFRDLTVEDNLRVGAFAVRGARREVADAVEGVLDQFPLLAARRRTQAGYLSGGEQQLLVLARALVSSPRLLLLDEPALGLAHGAIDEVAGVVRSVAERGTGVVLAERGGVMASACGASPVAVA